MPTLHVIDAARIAQETCRRYWPDSISRLATATWGDLPQDVRNFLVAEAQAVLDGKPQVADPDGDASRLLAAVVNALRPFLEE